MVYEDSLKAQVFDMGKMRMYTLEKFALHFLILVISYSASSWGTTKAWGNNLL